MRHFLDIRDHSADTLQAMLDHAAEMKSALKAGRDGPKPLAGKSVAMIFEKPSTRTRVSFEVGISQIPHPDPETARGELLDPAGTNGAIARQVLSSLSRV